jgi:hypothetical protein
MQRAIAAMTDRVQALETRLPIAATDPNGTAADPHADGIHSLKIQGLTMMSTPSFLILLHANVDPSTDRLWEVIIIITTNTMFQR